MENSVETKLLTALVELEAAVKFMPVANPKPDLLPIFSRIDELTKQLPPQDSELRHFLQRKSYSKAKALLENRV